MPGGDLIRSPEILPTGRNIHAFDPFRMPTEFALRDGASQAQRLLEAHPTLPRSVALVLWGSDNIKSDGGPIAQALALMGARPRFDSYGRLSGADLIPLAELGRPRIDVVMTLSGIFRDLLPLQTRMLAEAAWKAATADEPAEPELHPRPCAGLCRADGRGHGNRLAPRLLERRRGLRIERQHAGRHRRPSARKTNWPTPTRRASPLPTAATARR